MDGHTTGGLRPQKGGFMSQPIIEAMFYGRINAGERSPAHHPGHAEAERRLGADAQGIPAEGEACPIRLPAALRTALSPLPGDRRSGGGSAGENRGSGDSTRDHSI